MTEHWFKFGTPGKPIPVLQSELLELFDQNVYSLVVCLSSTNPDGASTYNSVRLSTVRSDVALMKIIIIITSLFNNCYLSKHIKGHSGPPMRYVFEQNNLGTCVGHLFVPK